MNVYEQQNRVMHPASQHCPKLVQKGYYSTSIHYVSKHIHFTYNYVVLAMTAWVNSKFHHSISPQYQFHP